MTLFDLGAGGASPLREPGPSEDLAAYAMTDDIHTPHWFLLTVRIHSERKVAGALLAKGFEVYLPMQAAEKSRSVRGRKVSTPLFSNNVFCRFPLLNELMVLKAPGVFSIFEQRGRPFPIPDAELVSLQRTLAFNYPLENAEYPSAGDVVEIGVGDDAIRGVLVERSSVCKVAIGFDTIERTIVLRIPLEDLKPTDGTLTPHWSLKSLGSVR